MGGGGGGGVFETEKHRRNCCECSLMFKLPSALSITAGLADVESCDACLRHLWNDLVPRFN